MAAAVASTRRLASDSGAAAWVSTADKTTHDLSLGFNAGPSSAHGPTPIWPTSASRLGYGEMGMFVVAPATSFHHHSSAAPSTHHHHHDSSFMSDPHLGVSVGVIPLLTATPCLNVAGGGIDGDGSHNRSGIHHWQQNHAQIHQQDQSTTYNNQQNNSTNNNNSKNKGSINFESVGSGLLFSGGGGGSGGAASSGTATCQDCGNQAKKDCSHRRCRTCCRSRGFDCSTHVKSTWVPASRRRERQMMGVVAGVSGGGGGASSGSTSGAKKPRLISSQNTATTSPSNTPPRSLDTSSSHQDASFKSSLPGQVRAPAVFKCVRVTAVEDGEDEFAYQAVVNIGGHVFKGFLYDQGLESRDGTTFPNLSELHLSGGSGSGAGPNSCPAPIVNSSNVYGGSSYGNTIN